MKYEFRWFVPNAVPASDVIVEERPKLQYRYLESNSMEITSDGQWGIWSDWQGVPIVEEEKGE